MRGTYDVFRDIPQFLRTIVTRVSCATTDEFVLDRSLLTACMDGSVDGRTCQWIRGVLEKLMFIQLVSKLLVHISVAQDNWYEHSRIYSLFATYFGPILPSSLAICTVYRWRFWCGAGLLR